MNAGMLLLVGACSMLGAILLARRFPHTWLILNSAGCLSGLAAALTVFRKGNWEWQSSIMLGGEAASWNLDGVSGFFLVLLSIVGFAATIYSTEYWTPKAHPRSTRAGRAWWSALLLCMGCVLVAANGLHFLIAWELFAVSAYFLITQERSQSEVRRAGWLYLAASHAGTLCLFGFFAALAAKTGTWKLGPMRDHSELAPLFWLALFGFGLKAGLFPLHVWLPSAHANAPSHVSAILSGVAIKMGIYGLVRFTGWLPLPSAAGPAIIVLGLLSSVLGVAFALAQHDLKRLLAYHSVENIGIILIGLGFGALAVSHGSPGWGILAMAGGLLHVWNHGLFKGLLFLGAGSVLHATGTRQMSRLGGLWKQMPWTAGCFTLGAVAISGLPPLNGFISEWLIYLGLFDAVGQRGNTAYGAAPAIVLLAVTGALALACFVKVVGVVFLGLPRSNVTAHAHDCGPRMRGGMLLLAGGCILIGLAPVVVWPILTHVVYDWRPEFGVPVIAAPVLTLGLCNVLLALIAIAAIMALWGRARRNGIARAGTWDCGYAAPTPRMQYTASSFAQIITGWFAWILRPERHARLPEGIFPVAAHLREHTPETVLEKVVEPSAGTVMTAANAVRRLQHGRLQAYLVYLALGLAAIAILACLGANRP